MSSTSKKVAIVTGASGGIGAAVAKRLANDGFSVVVNFVGNEEAADKVVSDIVAARGAAIAVKADVSDPNAMAGLFNAAESAFGGTDILINNGGIMKLSPIGETTDELFDQQIAVNLKGVFNGMREAAKRLRDGGRIVSFSSSVVGLYQPTYGVYAATKAGVEAMTHILSKELRGRSITVNAIAPGPVATKLFLEGKPKEAIEGAAKMSPMGRLGEPDDIARAVSFLVSSDAGWINGQVLRANGGII